MKLGEILTIQEKSKIKAGDGIDNGIFPFFTCSNDVVKTHNFAQYKGPALIFGTGGKASVHFCSESFSTSTDCLVYKTSKEVNLSLVNKYLRKNMYLLENGFKGAGLKHISREYIANIEIPLPEILEQNKLVSQFDLIESSITNHKKMLEKYDTLIKSRFIEMFGDPSKNNKKWEIKKLGDIIRVLGGYAFSSKAFKESGIPVLRIGNINSGVFRPTNMVFWDDDEKIERYAIYPSDLVMSLTGTVGKDDYGNVCILGNDYPKYYLNQRNAKLEIISDLERLYLSYLLKFPEIKSRLTNISRGIRQANIANKDIENLQIPVPPLSLQNQFATFVQQIDKSKFENNYKELTA